MQFEDGNYEGGANDVSLIQARENYATFGACNESSVEDVRLPTAKEIPNN